MRALWVTLYCTTLVACSGLDVLAESDTLTAELLTLYGTPLAQTGATADTAVARPDPAVPDCVEGDFGDGVPVVVSRTTEGAGDDDAGSCGGDEADDVVLYFSAPFEGRFAFLLDEGSTTSDAVLYTRNGCGGAEGDCLQLGAGQGGHVALDLVEGESTLVVVDGGVGPFQVGAYAVLPAEVDCADGFDGDFDGLVDCADDDCAESCAEPQPELCDSDVDEDLDGLVDCADPDCVALDLCSCLEDQADGLLPETLTGDTRGEANDFLPDCLLHYVKKFGAGFFLAPDVQLEYTAPQAGTFVFDTVGSDFDTTLSILDSCDAAQIRCNDDWVGLRSQLVHTLAEGESIVLSVDGFSNEDGDFVLNVAELEASEGDCADGRDLDHDGDVDCADVDCIGDPAC